MVLFPTWVSTLQTILRPLGCAPLARGSPAGGLCFPPAARPLLSLTRAENCTYTRMHTPQAPQEHDSAAAPVHRPGALCRRPPAWLGGTQQARVSRSRLRERPTCPTLTNSAWRASSFFRADLGDSGNTSLKERLFSMF